jgi:hypothetical protein
VNGIADAVEVLADGTLVTVDGHLGIVTVGEPEFTLERSYESRDSRETGNAERGSA